MSTLLEVIGLLMLVKAASILGGAGAAWIVAAFSLLFIGYSLSDGAVDLAVRRLYVRLKHSYRRQVATEASGSPHPPIVVSPESDEFAKRAARSYVRRLAMKERRTIPDDDE